MRWPWSAYRRAMGWKAVARWFVPLTEKHYGVRHIWLGPIHVWFGNCVNRRKAVKGMALR